MSPESRVQSRKSEKTACGSLLWTLDPRLWTLFAVLLLAVGCRIPHRVPLTETGSPRYERVEIEYDLKHPQQILAATEAPYSRAIRPVSATTADTQADNFWSQALLDIEYPHPEGAPEMARATLRLVHLDPSIVEPKPAKGEKLHAAGHRLAPKLISEPAGPPAPLREETRVLDFPRQQLDLLVMGLAHSGFFDRQSRPQGDVQLAVEIDRGRTAKTWTPEPRLDDFIDRVYREGRDVE